MPTHRTVEFYFDTISPYSWLAAKQCERVEAAGICLDFRPVLLAGLLAAHGSKGPAEIPAKRAYTMRDVMRIAARLGLPMVGPPTHPFNPLRSLRMCIALDDPGARQRFGTALLDAAWARGLDLADDTVLTVLAHDCGLDGRALLERAGDAEVRQRLVHATESAVGAGIFGVPTYRLEDEIFWGEDRIDALLSRLQGQTIDEALLTAVLARPASGSRKSG